MEVAGLVLGALPIALAVIQGYQKMGTAFRKIRPKLNKYTTSLEMEFMLFEEHLRILLLPLVADEDKIDALLADPGGDDWNQEETKEKLENKLGRFYDTYFKLLRDLKDDVKELSAELGLSSLAVQLELGKGVGGNPKKASVFDKMISRENMEFQKFRVKFALDGGAKIGDLLDRLQKDRKRLNDLLEQLDKAAQLRQKHQQSNFFVTGTSVSKSSSSLDAAMCSFWKRAATLYSIIQAVWGGCGCPKQHVARMLLQHQPATTSSKQPKFEILFATSDHQLTAWQLRRALVTLGEDKRRAFTPVLPLATLPATTPGITPAAAPGFHPGHRQTILPKSAMRKQTHVVDDCGLDVARSMAGMTAKSLVMVTAQAIPSIVHVRKATVVVHERSQAEMITNLCASLNQTPGEQVCAGFLRDDRDDNDFYIYPEATEMTSQLKSVTLEQLIRNEVRPFTYRQRLFLSMTLASAFLQLLDSPWIPFQWTEADILFFPDPENPEAFLLNKPHLRGDPAPEASGDDGSTSDISRREQTHCGRPRGPTREEKRHEALGRLGIVLEELFFKTHIETYRQQQPGYLEPQDPAQLHMINLFAGNKWLQEFDLDEPLAFEFCEAAKWCFTGNHGSSGGGSSSADAWRREMQTFVVGPLEASYHSTVKRAAG